MWFDNQVLARLERSFDSRINYLRARNSKYRFLDRKKRKENPFLKPFSFPSLSVYVSVPRPSTVERSKDLACAGRPAFRSPRDPLALHCDERGQWSSTSLAASRGSTEIRNFGTLRFASNARGPRRRWKERRPWWPSWWCGWLGRSSGRHLHLVKLGGGYRLTSATDGRALLPRFSFSGSYRCWS